jgi:hypothetical protein
LQARLLPAVAEWESQDVPERQAAAEPLEVSRLEPQALEQPPALDRVQPDEQPQAEMSAPEPPVAQEPLAEQQRGAEAPAPLEDELRRPQG